MRDANLEFVREYEAATPASAALHHALCARLPGGDTRAVAHFEPYPLVLTEGHGPYVRDADDNEYIDVVNNYTSLVHGHAYPAIVEAVQAVLVSGTAFPAPHPFQLELADLLSQRYPAVDKVRFTNSGTEAAMLALRIARKATGRQRVVLAEAGYHGCAPEFVDPDPATTRVPYNDPSAGCEAVDSSVAAVFVEPFLGSGGVVPASEEFLLAMQEAARAAGAVLVLDEVQSLRNGVHGVHGSLGLEPDMILMGKIIGGGFPVGAVGGRGHLLDLTDARTPAGVVHSGTFNGNVVTMAAGIACMSALDETAIADLEGRATRVASEIELAASSARVPSSVTRAGSIMQVHLSANRPTTASEVSAIPAAYGEALHLALLLEGVYAAPRGMLNLSTVLGDDETARVIAAYGRAFVRIRDLVNPESRVIA